MIGDMATPRKTRRIRIDVEREDGSFSSGPGHCSHDHFSAMDVNVRDGIGERRQNVGSLNSSLPPWREGLSAGSRGGSAERFGLLASSEEIGE